MPPKALDYDLFRFMVMQICHELGKTENDISTWTPEDVYRWAGYFRLKNEMEAKAYEKARRQNGGGGGRAFGGSNVRTIIE